MARSNGSIWGNTSQPTSIRLRDKPKWKALAKETNRDLTQLIHQALEDWEKDHNEPTLSDFIEHNIDVEMLGTDIKCVVVHDHGFFRVVEAKNGGYWSMKTLKFTTEICDDSLYDYKGAQMVADALNLACAE